MAEQLIDAPKRSGLEVRLESIVQEQQYAHKNAESFILECIRKQPVCDSSILLNQNKDVKSILCSNICLLSQYI